MDVLIKPIKPKVGALVSVDKDYLTDPGVAEELRSALEDRGVLVFSEINLTDAEQLAFTDAIGVLSARMLSGEGGATEFANLYAAYEALADEEMAQIENLRVIHHVEASVRPVFGLPSPERVERYRNLAPALVWKHHDGRKSLLFGTHADGIVGMPARTPERC